MYNVLIDIVKSIENIIISCNKEGTVESADEKDDQLKHWLSQEYVLLGIKYYVSDDKVVLNLL